MIKTNVHLGDEKQPARTVEVTEGDLFLHTLNRLSQKELKIVATFIGDLNLIVQGELCKGEGA